MLYRVLHFLFNIIFRILGFKVEGSHNIPRKGPYIIAANHLSNWDPIFVALAFPHPVAYMAKCELFRNKLLAGLLNQLYAFPVQRGKADRQAIRIALKTLQDGNVLGIFPEGHRQKSGVERSVHSGVALLALKSGAPVIPVACVGTKYPFGWVKPLKICIGEPISVEINSESKAISAVLDKISYDIMEKIMKLLKP